jgi:glycine/D-amino acid oxidase-like deaminating enzyme
LCFEEAMHAAEYLARAQRLAIDHEVLDRARVLAAWPQLTNLVIASAIHVPSDGVIDASILLRALSSNLRIELGTRAIHVAPGFVETNHGRIDTQVVVDAMGPWAGALTGPAADSSATSSSSRPHRGARAVPLAPRGARVCAPAATMVSP